MNAAIQRLREEWERMRTTSGTLVVLTEAHEHDYVSIALFADRASFDASAADPDQLDWCIRFRDLLTDDPGWDDGEVVFSSMPLR